MYFLAGFSFIIKMSWYPKVLQFRYNHPLWLYPVENNYYYTTTELELELTTELANLT